MKWSVKGLSLALGPMIWALVESVGTDNIPVYAIPPNFSPSITKSIDFYPLPPSESEDDSPVFPSSPSSSFLGKEDPKDQPRARRKRSEDDGSDMVGTRGWADIVNEVDIPSAKFNETVEAHKHEDNSTTASDDHIYYKQEHANFEEHWVDLDAMAKESSASVQVHQMLSQSYRRADTIQLTFPFPFYGHNVKNITIATGGFLYTGQYVHSWLAATQYIAPLMANFDTSKDEVAQIRYADNGTAMIVEWTNVHLKGQNGNETETEGTFTFQAILHHTGDIVFAYKNVPVRISTIEDEEHPVRVGLSDAYIIDRTIFFVRRKTIYEYHRLNMENDDVANNTAIYFRALPTCNRMDTCSACLNTQEKLKCQWCPTIKACSDGVDRNRQRWLKNSCDEIRLTHPAECNHINNGEIVRRLNYNQNLSPAGGSQQLTEEAATTDKSTHAGIATLAIIIFLIVSIFAWVGYAYFFPHTWSGQLLIKYRPTRWHWLRSEPRYTAASIHM